MSLFKTPIDTAPYEPLSVVIADAGPRQQRHIVRDHAGEIVAFLCGRWRHAGDVMRSGVSRRSVHICRTCYKTWNRQRKEQSS
jgi:hypothetical protein